MFCGNLGFPLPGCFFGNHLDKVIFKKPCETGNRPQVFQNKLFQDDLADVVRPTDPGVALVVRTDEMVLCALETLRGGKVQLRVAVRTGKQTRKQGLPPGFGHAAFVFPQRLYSVPLRPTDDRRMGILEYDLVGSRVCDAFLVFEGFAVRLEIDHVSKILIASENPLDRAVIPMIWVQWRRMVCFSSVRQRICGDGRYFFLPEPFGDPRRPQPRNAQIEYFPDDRRRVLVDDPFLRVVRVFSHIRTGAYSSDILRHSLWSASRR